MTVLELPGHDTRPEQFRYRCWLCGAPALRVLCCAHTWLATDDRDPGDETEGGDE